MNEYLSRFDNMETFLEKLAGELLSRFGSFESMAVVFPTRRAALFFKDALARRIEKPMWTPVIYSIEDFIRVHAGANIPDLLALQVELFKVYKKYFPEEQFEDFLPWSEVMLNDFDEADKALVDAGAFFRNISELHELSETFGLAPEDEAHIRDFWMAYYGTSQGLLQERFYRSWSHLHAVYSDFRKALTEKGWAYEGMASRAFCESLEQQKQEIPFATTVFAGFYSLSKAEERIVACLVGQNRAVLYWDTDAYYTEDTRQEAGRFIRQNKLIEGSYSWKFNNFKEHAHKIVSIGVPLQVGQARSAGQVIEDLLQNSCNPRDIAVVLADEKLLFPMLYALPQAVTAVNVTMGFPVKESPLFDFIENLVQLQKHRRKSASGEEHFHHRQVTALLSHPVMRSAEPVYCVQWLRDFRENRWMRIAASVLAPGMAPALATAVFKPAPPGQLADYLLQVLSELLHGVRTRNERTELVESEFVFRFYTLVNRLRELLPEMEKDLSYDTFWQLLSRIASQVKVPFSGEPLEGLQIMGMLESRLLDFKHVILLSVNEDTLPAAGPRISFIPYGIRKAFGLPGREENHAVSAYHFFRLMQRASQVFLIHNAEAAGLSAGERSRFVSQVALELAKKYPDTVHYEEQVMLPEVFPPDVKPVAIAKSPAVLQALEKFRAGGQAAGPFTRKLSPSAISTYIHCSLKFYLSYVAGLKEADAVEDTMDSRLFGEVMHGALQSLYRKGRTYSANDLPDLLKDVPQAVDAAIREKYKADAAALEGKNIILRDVLVQLVAEVLKMDTRQAPFTVRHLEETFIYPFPLSSGEVWHVGGVVDRIDEYMGLPRILDYKTGNVGTSRARTIEDLFSDPKYKEQLQAWFYAWLYSKVTGRESIRSGLVVARQLADGIQYLNDGKPMESSQLKEFEEHLQGMLDGILNPATAFSQTDDVDRCRHCSFREICSR